MVSLLKIRRVLRYKKKIKIYTNVITKRKQHKQNKQQRKKITFKNQIFWLHTSKSDLNLNFFFQIGPKFVSQLYFIKKNIPITRIMLARLAIKNIANCDVFTGEFQLTLSSSLVLFVPIFSSFVS